MKQKLSIISPVYNNADSLEELYQRIKTLFSTDLAELDWEFILVNDGSKDNSLEILYQLYEQDKHIRVLNFSRNFGQLAALIAGFRHAQGDAAVCISADLQDDPQWIVSLVEAWLGGKEIVIAHRKNREDSFSARFFSGVFYFLMKRLYSGMPDGGFDFLLLSKKAQKVFNQLDGHYRFFQGDILSLGFSVAYVPYTRKARPHGKSQWTFLKKMNYFLDGIITGTNLPLRLMSLCGMGLLLLGSGWLIVLCYNWLFFTIIPEVFSWVAAALLMIFGGVFLTMGILGEYVWRIYGEVKKNPFYIIQEDKQHQKPKTQPEQ